MPQIANAPWVHSPAGATQYAGSTAFQAVKEAGVDAALFIASPRERISFAPNREYTQ